ncbi:MAG: BamA/TamA family outer membrane protein [Gracilimonas sp.]|uniref:BamA/TamA family outer membrane protein n=1 Tax=Gracilimonas sp. TaxID=1974203 RepID=UPI001B1FE042|nr:BamA/TamA family outer membrane protein [Gracilimonas sp.]MBO6586421.1 BamA/TamA family outer membrane protein [Gracilimonas sp.]MBO6615078.1 BamA/TamA family outer membrane protein [Gracilimonas sp.]
MFRKSILFITISFSVQLLLAQGFNSTSGRNHPELNWQVAETEHFLIMYPERIAGIEGEAAAIAEHTYESLSKNLEVTFDQKIRIYLSDEDEVNNGFAVPFSRPYTNIWVNLNDYSEIWTGQEKWLRKVIAHELAHIFHFEAVKSPLGLLQYTFANPLPGFWTEGLAQYETEKWDSQRGDRWLRKAIFDDDLNYSSGQSIEDGRLLYALGNSQLRYFAEQYGDTSLANLLQHRKKLFGLIRYHDFGSAFEETVDGGYSGFYDRWQKHVNVYYNTVASQMERTDSLHADEFSFPGQFYFDAAVSPDDSLLAVLSLTSMSRPVRRLYVTSTDSSRQNTLIGEGAINSDLNWLDPQRLLYSRMVRGKHSSLINDVFLYDLEKEKETRLTVNRKAKFPAAGSSQNQIGYIVNEGGTGNLFVMNLETRKEEKLTDYSGDVQLLWPLWIEQENAWLVHRFTDAGDRNLVLIDPKTRSEKTIDPEQVDNRKAILSPDGSKIAYISLRDEVPNVFIYDFESGVESRFTNLFTGGEVFGWVADFDSTGEEHLVIGASETRTQDKLHFVSAGREVYQPELNLPQTYASWRLQSPTNEIPSDIKPNPDLITDRYSYNAFQNLTHVASFGFPYYSDANDWGIFATSNWTEPLAKHTISGGGWLSIPDPLDKSYGALSYINNQLYPTLTFSVYQIPENGQYYGEEFLFEEYTGADIAINWPLDVFSSSYQYSSWSARFRHYSTDPMGENRFTSNPNLATPQNATVTDLQLSWQIKKQRPWKNNSYHPLDGTGLRLSVKGSEKILGSDTRTLTSDIHGYTVQPFLGLNRIFLEVRFQSQWGNNLPQNYIGFSRYDNVDISLPNDIPLQLFGDNERIRGYREFVTGKQVAFGSIEYRIPFIPSLQTQILGFVRLGGVSISLFSDSGIVWDARSESGATGTIQRWGAGAELKNEISIAGLSISHAFGVAQPAQQLFTDTKSDMYYRVQAVVPF